MVKAKKKRMKYYSVNIDGTLDKGDKKKLEGISGWLDLWFLYFVIIGIGIFLFTIAVPFSTDMYSFGVGVVLMRAIHFLFLIWMGYSFFTKEKVFIILVNIFLIVSIVGDLMDSDYLFAALNILWVGYFYKSKRVKNTFVK